MAVCLYSTVMGFFSCCTLNSLGFNLLSFTLALPPSKHTGFSGMTLHLLENNRGKTGASEFVSDCVLNISSHPSKRQNHSPGGLMCTWVLGSQICYVVYTALSPLCVHQWCQPGWPSVPFSRSHLHASFRANPYVWSAAATKPVYQGPDPNPAKVNGSFPIDSSGSGSKPLPSPHSTAF